MSISVKNKEIKEFMKNAQFVFMVNFQDNTQHITVGENVSATELVGAPFRLAVHLNNLLEENLRERQAREALEENTSTEAE